ncbi:hypothetical protein [Siphonobacter aquaeclarae]|uniref:Neutral/alkaline non-lysosomal ceramidase, N-terminal n=1 Tax=Siphonobacter aquaeclarae TaxID=563176 RepID=A0A1G9MSV5_9BACT|nr:hypothetical protein [Siphonobacter aquaeclarae]SDL77376.1 hypothetical protein SAMN04488090_1732 [Siphonobacter aquaeclarae]
MRNTIFLLCGLFLSFSGMAQSFRAGAAVRNITPDPLLPVSGGIGTPKKAIEKKGELSVRALVLEKGAVRIAIVGIDNLGWPAALGNKSRALIKSVAPANVLIGASHTHSGPDAYGFPNEKGENFADLKYLDRCVRLIAEAVEEAARKLEPATLKTAVGEAKGQIAYNYYAPQLYDPRCGIIQAISTAGKPIATLVNYAIHPEIIGSGRGILSPDLCGPLYDRIEAKTGGIALFINGAQGGMVTADNRRDTGEANDWAECTRIGELLADEALRIVATAPEQTDPGLYCVAEKTTFPVESEIMRYIIQKSPLGFSLENGNRVSAQVNLLNIGTAQVLTVPGEALPNVGYFVKRHMHTKTPFLFGLTNDAFGYMLSRVDFNSFKRYEYVSRTSLGENTAEIYMDEVLKLIEKSPSPDGYPR